MKPSDELKKMYSLYKGNDAQTIKEMCDESGLSESVVRRYMNGCLEKGTWKQVNIKTKTRISIAYVKVK